MIATQEIQLKITPDKESESRLSDYLMGLLQHRRKTMWHAA